MLRNRSQIEHFVAGLFALNTKPEQFKTHLRDFLVQLKEFNKEGNNEDLFSEERRQQQQALEVCSLD